MRVASVPAAHPYVEGLGLGSTGVELLSDPPVPGAPAGRWWPPAMLDPDWVVRHAAAFDLLHLHFGAESLSLERLRAVLEALRAVGRPFVHTVHDLTHPQLADEKHHERQLGLLLDRADALITLTPGAADEIRARCGREATVIPHPAMRGARDPSTDPRAISPTATAITPAGSPSGFRAAVGPAVVGIHLRDLRPGIDGPGTVATVAGALSRLRAAGTAVHGHVWLRERVRDPRAAAEVRRLAAGSPYLTLTEQPRVADAELEAQLVGLAVSVLPYRHGTHSGWLELCWDLGVPVAVPTIGHFAEQHPDCGFCRQFTPGDVAGLAAALAGLLTVPEARPGSIARTAAADARAAQRSRERPGLAAAHLAVYRSVLGA